MQLVQGVRDSVARHLRAARRLMTPEGHRKLFMRVDARGDVLGGADHRSAEACKASASVELITDAVIVPNADFDDDGARGEPRNYVVALMQEHGSVDTEPKSSRDGERGGDGSLFVHHRRAT